MSHIGLRILADWLQDSGSGINALRTLVPRDAGDRLPPPVNVYDATRSSIVARGRIPHPDLAGDVVRFPAVLVAAADLSYDEGNPVEGPSGPYVEGVLTAVVMLILRDGDTDGAITDGMYLTRAARGSLSLFNQAPDATRTRLGVRLEPSDGAQVVQIDGVPDDLFVPQAFLATYPFTEVVPGF